MFWYYHDKLYQNQTDITEERLIEYAKELNMNVRAFESCLSSRVYQQEVAEDLQDGIEAGVQGTPTFFVNGNRIRGAAPQDVMVSLIERGLIADEYEAVLE